MKWDLELEKVEMSADIERDKLTVVSGLGNLTVPVNETVVEQMVEHIKWALTGQEDHADPQIIPGKPLKMQCSPATNGWKVCIENKDARIMGLMSRKDLSRFGFVLCEYFDQACDQSA